MIIFCAFVRATVGLIDRHTMCGDGYCLIKADDGPRRHDPDRARRETHFPAEHAGDGRRALATAIIPQSSSLQDKRVREAFENNVE